MNPQDAQYIRDVARALLREMEMTGHICLHAEDWGQIKQALADHKEALDRQEAKLDTLVVDMASMRGERRIAAAVIGFLGALVGGVVTAIAGRSQ
jgi:hypothetical protein